MRDPTRQGGVFPTLFCAECSRQPSRGTAGTLEAQQTCASGRAWMKQIPVEMMIKSTSFDTVRDMETCPLPRLWTGWQHLRLETKLTRQRRYSAAGLAAPRFLYPQTGFHCRLGLPPAEPCHAQANPRWLRAQGSSQIRLRVNPQNLVEARNAHSAWPLLKANYSARADNKLCFCCAEGDEKLVVLNTGDP